MTLQLRWLIHQLAELGGWGALNHSLYGFENRKTLRKLVKWELKQQSFQWVNFDLFNNFSISIVNIRGIYVCIRSFSQKLSGSIISWSFSDPSLLSLIAISSEGEIEVSEVLPNLIIFYILYEFLAKTLTSEARKKFSMRRTYSRIRSEYVNILLDQGNVAHFDSSPYGTRKMFYWRKSDFWVDFWNWSVWNFAKLQNILSFCANYWWRL